MNRFDLEKTITLHNFDWRVRSNQLGYLKIELLGAHWSVFFFSVFVVPDYGAVTFFYIGAVDIVAILLHNLLKDLEPVFVKYFKQSLPLPIYAVFVAAFGCQPQVRNA